MSIPFKLKSKFYSFMRVELTPRNTLLTPVCLLLFWSENKGVNIQ